MGHLLVSLPCCCSSCPWPGSGSSARQCHVPQRCHLCFGAGCSGEHGDASLCQCPLRSICRFVVTAEQTLFSQQPQCLTLPNGHVSPLSPEMPWYWKNTKLDETFCNCVPVLSQELTALLVLFTERYFSIQLWKSLTTHFQEGMQNIWWLAKAVHIRKSKGNSCKRTLSLYI